MPRILVIDDQKDARAMIGMVLRLNRFEVSEAESAKAGLKVFAEGGFDAGESGEFNQAAMRLARYSSSHPAVLRRSRMESLPGAFRVRL